MDDTKNEKFHAPNAPRPRDEPVHSPRRIAAEISLTAGDYQHTGGDTEMATKRDGYTVVEVRMTLTPKPNFQKPTEFEVSIFNQHREGKPDNTQFTADGVRRSIPIELLENEYFARFEDNVRDYSFCEHITGKRHTWVPIRADCFVDEIKVHFDGMGKDDQHRQGLRASLTIPYVVAYYPPTPE